MKKIVLFFCFLGLVSCASRQLKVEYMYDGQNGKVYQAYCNDKNTMGECYKLANETCKGDFAVLNKSQNNYAKIRFDTSNPISYNKTRRTLLFYCK